MSEFRSKEYGEGSNKAALLVAGFDGCVTDFEHATVDLVSMGYDVIAYDYTNDVLLSGEAESLPNLIDKIASDFAHRTSDYEQRRHLGASLGAGIAWNAQKRDESPEVGIYAAGGANFARIIMKNLVFREVVIYSLKVNPTKEFEKKGWDEASLSEFWSSINKPPESGFVMTLGGLDYINSLWRVIPSVRAWRREGIDFLIHLEKAKGHTGTIDWFNQNVAQLIDEADTLVTPTKYTL